ncbi:Nif3-like dinuclear metal center hexameric protein [Aciduricibacillus chroicocephali]|uniref:GTP cyclohydrolase 1 type 2 homolog n=1 Tax=Aciduricibacillus chroicocephali TaxID=3054939 RepID=A0ABY9KS17_9BACI|nr:Nif3-like dinuclear metal center hexameric protein [Bacillaceae bacterium 44XB]
MVRNSDIFQAIERWAPKWLASSWDNVGLQVGSTSRESKKVLVTLDVLENVADEAIQEGADLIIAHHPLMFKPLKKLDTDSPKGRIIEKLIENKISVYAAHTNLDIANHGMNDILAKLLGLQNTVHMIEEKSEKLLKVAVYIPKDHESELRSSLGEAGAGHIGNYSHCTFRYAGTGTFKPDSGTNPFIGEEGKLEQVDEVKVETIIKEAELNSILEVIHSKHPYEEPAIDIYALENKGVTYGLGKVGTLEESMTLESFAKFVKERLGMDHLRYIGEPTKLVSSCAVLGGSGEKYIEDARRSGVDVYVTGDVSFHTAQDAEAMGLAVVDAGHYIEKAIKKEIAAYLEEVFGTELEVNISASCTDPFRFV